MGSVILAAVGVLASGGPARAQGFNVLDLDPVIGEGLFPRMATLDRGGTGNGVGLDAALLFPDEGGGWGIRTELGGQFYLGEGRFGAALSLPVNQFFPDEGASNAALGNLGIDGLFDHKVGNNLKLVGRLGMLLPTSSDDLEDVTTNSLGQTARLTDLAQSVPQALAIRASASALYDKDRFFARADLGFDVFLDNAGDETADPLFRLNLGGGVHVTPAASLALELVNVSGIGGNGSFSDRTLHTLAVSALFATPPVRPYLSFILPLDDEVRGELWILAVGGVIIF
jgi:hypothetical protein